MATFICINSKLHINNLYSIENVLSRAAQIDTRTKSKVEIVGRFSGRRCQLFEKANFLLIEGGVVAFVVVAALFSGSFHVVVVDLRLLHEVDVGDERLAEFEENPLFVRAPSLLLELLPQRVHRAADLQRRSQFDLHGRHEMIGFEQHQRLTVDLLQLEVFDVVGATVKILDKVADLLHRPLQWVAVLLEEFAGGFVRVRRRFLRFQLLRCGRVISLGCGGRGGLSALKELLL